MTDTKNCTVEFITTIRGKLTWRHARPAKNKPPYMMTYDRAEEITRQCKHEGITAIAAVHFHRTPENIVDDAVKDGLA